MWEKGELSGKKKKEKTQAKKKTHPEKRVKGE